MKMENFNDDIRDFLSFRISKKTFEKKRKLERSFKITAEFEQVTLNIRVSFLV